MNNGIFKSKTCPYCGVPITPNAAIQPGHCGAADCMTRHVVLGHKAVQAARVEVATRNVKVASEADETAELPGLAGVASLEDMVLVTVPHQNKPLVPVPAERMEVFQENLRSSIEEAFAADDTEIASIQIERNSQAEQPILAAGCATCQGYCCGLGAANNAFLNAEVIKGHRQLWPELTPEIILENYQSRLPDVAAQNGCVYQGALGCTLPREMRSSICNTFHCHEVEYAAKQAEEHPDRPVALVGMDEGGDPQNFAVLSDEAGWQRLDRPAPDLLGDAGEDAAVERAD